MWVNPDIDRIVYTSTNLLFSSIVPLLKSHSNHTQSRSHSLEGESANPSAVLDSMGLWLFKSLAPGLFFLFSQCYVPGWLAGWLDGCLDLQNGPHAHRPAPKDEPEISRLVRPIRGRLSRFYSESRIAKEMAQRGAAGHDSSVSTLLVSLLL